MINGADGHSMEIPSAFSDELSNSRNINPNNHVVNSGG